MLDQDSARALLVIADERDTRVALVGDRHQLPAVGRGGVLDLAARWAKPESCLALDTVHRFADPDYGELSLAMRTSRHPGRVVDTLLARGGIRVYPSEGERTRALALIGAQPWAGASGEPVLVIADTREQVAALNGTIRDQLITTGRVQDIGAVTTAAGNVSGSVTGSPPASTNPPWTSPTATPSPSPASDLTAPWPLMVAVVNASCPPLMSKTMWSWRMRRPSTAPKATPSPPRTCSWASTPAPPRPTSE